MTVHFIGAGPGAPDLITLRGQRLIQSCSVCLFAGSLVPPAIIAMAPPEAHIRDTSGMHLDEIIDACASAHAGGHDVARVHSGDPSLYGAIAEQIRRLDALGIPFDITPGVPAFAAAAAELGQELTIPEVSQTLIVTRTAMKSTGMPPGESLDNLARSGATLAIHLSARNARDIERRLIPAYGADCPVVIAYRIGWPDQQIIRTHLAGLRTCLRDAKITRTALILVGSVLAPSSFRDSALYAEDHPHILRPHARRDAGGRDR